VQQPLLFPVMVSAAASAVVDSRPPFSCVQQRLLYSPFLRQDTEYSGLCCTRGFVSTAASAVLDPRPQLCWLQQRLLCPTLDAQFLSPAASAVLQFFRVQQRLLYPTLDARFLSTAASAVLYTKREKNEYSSVCCTLP
jgi:hypothetical protein